MDMFNDLEELDEIHLVIYGIPRQIYDRAEYFHSFDDLKFFQRFRITKRTAILLLEKIEVHLEYPYDWNNAVAPINQLLVFLRFCASGGHIVCVADFAGVHKSTASRIIKRVSEAIAQMYARYIKMPSNQNEINQTQMEFYEICRFPKVIGSLDCTHIRIQSPGGEDAEIFRNRKGYFSINVQCICDANLKIMNLVARWPGSTHDVTIFNNSHIRQQFEANEFHNSLLIGDNGYNLRRYLVTPLLNPVGQVEHLYNESLIRTRNTIERCFGVLKRRFPILAYGSRLKLETTLIVIVAVAIVYNIAKENNEEEPPDPENIERFLEVMADDEVPNIPFEENIHGLGFHVRQELINYFGNLVE